MIRLLIADDETSILFALLGAGEYDLVIADLRLCAARPQGGLAVAAAVKERWPRTRTMILTAYGSPEVEAQARRAGVDAFLHKQDRLKHVAVVVRGLTAARA